MRKAWKYLEEELMSREGSFGQPILYYARDLLQGERLQDAVLECVYAIHVDDVSQTSATIEEPNFSINRNLLPRVDFGPLGVVELIIH